MVVEFLVDRELRGPFFDFYFGDAKLINVSEDRDLYFRIYSSVLVVPLREKKRWEEVENWCNQNLEGKLYINIWSDYRKTPTLLFTSEKDKLLFSLKWID